MTVFMAALMLVMSLLACYFPAVAGARGRGSRKSWIGLIFVGLFVGAASMMLGHHLVGTFDTVLLSQLKGEPFVNHVAVNLLAVIVRISIAFSIGSFLAALLYRNGKDPKDSANLLGLGNEVHHRKI